MSENNSPKELVASKRAEWQAEYVRSYRGSADCLRKKVAEKCPEKEADLRDSVAEIETLMAGLSDEEILNFRAPWHRTYEEVRERISNVINPYIKIEELVDGAVYEISARNANVGIWRAEQRGFEIPREKFHHLYLFVEYHWDTGAPFGTVKPWGRLEDLPEELRSDDAGRLDWLDKLNMRVIEARRAEWDRDQAC